MIASNFIVTELFHQSGEAGERVVWEAIQRVFYGRECLAYWRYPLFLGKGKFRKEPDILIADRELGLIIIEVKSIKINQIISIQGHRWQYKNFYTKFGNPYQQAENQLFALLDYAKTEPSLDNQVTGRVMVALPLITQQQWQEKEFDKLPSNPPILFKNSLDSSALLFELIEKTTPVLKREKLSNQQWELLTSILSGTPVLSQPIHRVLSGSQSRGKVLQELRSQVSQLDLQQEKIAKQIPPGCQRIRGIAGSGKTVLLCQKVAIMHLKYPQWKIAFVFFSRSLYEEITTHIDRWIRYFSHNQQGYDPNNRNLRVFHAWGSEKKLGFYRFVSQVCGKTPLSVNQTTRQKPNEALGEVCYDLLNKTGIPQIFDAILIDEGQDLMVDHWHYQGKQPFYWLAYQSLRPVNSIYPEQKRLIWAYDEVQSLDSLKMPTAREMFGEELGHLVTGKHFNGINKTEVMCRCYRTPHPIIIAAHAMVMGWLRPEGMLTGMRHKEEWQALGYEVTGELISGNNIIIKRPKENSPNPLPYLWKDDLIKFEIYSSRQQEMSALYRHLKHNLRQDGLRPSKEILVIVLGEFFEAANLQKNIANFLIRQGIDIFIPGTKDCNILTHESEENCDQFWCAGGVTISRIYQAKGQEADQVYIIGLDHIAEEESNLSLRNQLFIALTRSRGWVNISGIGNYPLYQELQNVLNNGDTFSVTFAEPQQREIIGTDEGELLKSYSLGRRNFEQAALQNAQLNRVNLSDINLIGANLSGARFNYTNLNRAKLIAANLQGADLTGASLIKAKLMGANLKGANLQEADLTQADLSNVDLTGALVEPEQLEKAIFE
ncbi:pentapeptide repeat protein [Rippkaea orientalis PCC 8801]|uniref:Pentapeptide repeat protein n=1 Tax=Rippkaea orientalis (strain PCC 8801 / RF-1) TaxID=41431 RepID=B7K2Q8_RIPO1|nr:pentapeptide repeat-containing protein [Rippkaea orientalis]ACK66451.1 pentapeptide repeat protein [Rippkaea orientalis PCC 8801]